jgi:hypothetical protein
VLSLGVAVEGPESATAVVGCQAGTRGCNKRQWLGDEKYSKSSSRKAVPNSF